MKVNLTYGLLLTPYEMQWLPSAPGFDLVAEQDFAVHARYCNDTKKFVFLGDNPTHNATDFLSSFFSGLAAMGIECAVTKKVITLSGNECEYQTIDVEKYFH